MDWQKEEWSQFTERTITFRFKTQAKLLRFIKEQQDGQFAVTSYENTHTQRTNYLYSTVIGSKYVERDPDFEYGDQNDE